MTINSTNNPANAKTPHSQYRLRRIREKAAKRGELKQSSSTVPCIYDSRYMCNPNACPPICERLANIKTTGERHPCQTQAA